MHDAFSSVSGKTRCFIHQSYVFAHKFVEKSAFANIGSSYDANGEDVVFKGVNSCWKWPWISI